MPKIADEAREQRRTQFTAAAWRCVAERGYRSLTVDDICQEAGLSKGAFYTYFATKQDLLFALLDEESATMEALIAELTDARESAIERTRRLIQEVLARAEDSALVQLRADLWAEMQADDSLRERMVEVVATRRRLFATWITEAVEAGELVEMPANAFAAILVALTDGLMLHRALDPSGFRWANVRRAVDALLAGITESSGTDDSAA
jgi:AcrR family transcriptional regulator